MFVSVGALVLPDMGSIRHDTKARIPSQRIFNADVTYSWEHDRYNIALECPNFSDETVYDNYKLQKPGRAFFAKFRVFID